MVKYKFEGGLLFIRGMFNIFELTEVANKKYYLYVIMIYLSNT